jgi:protein-S-isoprenylcysteine O-methyltransferase Ste14
MTIAMTEQPKDTAGVIAPPPLLALAVVVVGMALDWLAPAYVLTVLLTVGERIFIGVVLMAAGLGLALPAITTFSSAGTPVEPWKATKVLATQGIFSWLRNPMYVGATLLLAGLAILLASDWMLVMTIAFALVIHFGVVLREERYLTAKFGEAYAEYRRLVPRYGIRI